MSIGNGFIGVPNDEFSILDIPHELLIHSTGDPIDYIVDEIYPNFVDVDDHVDYYQKRAILAPKNEMVN